MEAVSHVGGSSVARESRRRKTVWEAWQKEALLSAFSKSSYLSFEDRQELARQTGLPASRIRVWFQNRRNRTGEVGHAPKRSSRGSSQLASPQLQEEHDSRAQGRGMPSDPRRPRTRLSLQQRRILGQAFERNPLPGFATREELAQRTGLPEDTIHIWFQNRRARHQSRSRSTAQDQDLLGSHRSDGASALPRGREHEGGQDSLLPVSAAGSVGMDPWSLSDLTTFCRTSQTSQVAQPSGAGQEEAPTRASSPGPLENPLDQLLDEVQMEEEAPVKLDPDGGPHAKEYAGTQDSLLLVSAAGNVDMDAWSPSDLPTFCRESQPSQVAQPSGVGQEEAPTRASSPGPLENLLDQLLDEVQREEQAPVTLDPDGGPCSKEYAGTQDRLLPLDEAGDVGMDPWSPSDLHTFCRESQPSQVAQHSEACQAQARPQASNPSPLELFLVHLLTEVQVEERVSAPPYMEDAGEPMDTTPELPLTQEDYQALLDMI